MPRIPIVQESLRANTSSPVPISSTGDARMTGEAVKDLGQAFAALGSKMEKDSFARDQLDAKSAQALWRDNMQKRKEAIIQNGADADDPSGQMTLKRIEDEGRGVADEIRSKLSPRAANMFTAEINNEYTNETRPKMFIEMSRAVEAQTQRSRTNMVNGMVAAAREAPSEWIDIQNEKNITIMADQSLSMEEKAKLIEKSDKDMAEGVMDGFRERGDFDGGLEFLKINSSSFDPQTRKFWSEKLSDEKWQKKSRAWSAEDRQYREQRRGEQSISDILMSNFKAQLLAGQAQGVRDAVTADAAGAYSAGVLKEPEYNQLMGNTPLRYSRPGDGKVMGENVLAPLFKSDLKATDYDAAINKTRELTYGKNPTLSEPVGKDWIQKLEFMRDREMKGASNKGRNLGEAVKRAQTYGKTGQEQIDSITGNFYGNQEETERLFDVTRQLFDVDRSGGDPLAVVDGLSEQSLGNKRGSFKGLNVSAKDAQDPAKAAALVSAQKPELMKTTKGKQQYLQNLMELKKLRDSKNVEAIRDVQTGLKKQGGQ